VIPLQLLCAAHFAAHGPLAGAFLPPSRDAVLSLEGDIIAEIIDFSSFFVTPADFSCNLAF